ncbi:hypothetical protein ESY86_06860 [Subsaximicrobium wynnwilliamsii]|uniref:CAP-Gly protein n=1 Tax=Subsaximicrobium wynnwilliamsii TaxID=291179 RepID=A0A5C6ZJ26_9FLAO|nr:hypothetical protein [Subsaximicrobium wynnwilliamsii]TXD81551.1 hypothetical protein ESY87_17475 [Subsaximicrobium wynnwilliamsii]TXD89913.1 hypothetical protein ESY86_06860 [Subsaximicrobium wynnwilliamsii]TXE01012.1 hypothetical protein ESY88_17470 [Subsaximicrobium wynnwilliamsii]
MKNVSTHLNYAKNRISRISWGGVLAGALTAITISFLLNLLGLGLGLNSIDPLTEAQPFSGLGIGTIVWWVLSNLAALFVGGLIAARAAGLPSGADGGIHGFLAWGAYLLVSIFIVTSITGSIFSGMGSLVSSVFGGDSAKEVVVNMKKAQDATQSGTDTTIQGVKDEIYQILETAQEYNLIPEGSKSEVKAEYNEAKAETQKAIKELDLKDALTDFVNDVSVNLDRNGDLDISVEGNQEYIDKETLKDYLTENTALSDEEINGVITKWETKIDKAITEIEETYAEAKEQALKASEEVSDALGTASIYLFFMLLLGALAAFFGGATGAPKLGVIEERNQDLQDEQHM